MMLPALAALADLEARLPSEVTTGRESSRAEAALEDASALVREECGRDFLDESGEPAAPDAIVRVVLAVARRDFLNPEGTRSDTETVGPYSQTRTRSASDTGCYLTEAEQAICARYRESGSSGLWTLSTTRDGDEEDTWWYDVDYPGGEPFPLLRGDEA